MAALTLAALCQAHRREGLLQVVDHPLGSSRTGLRSGCAVEGNTGVRACCFWFLVPRTHPRVLGPQEQAGPGAHCAPRLPVTSEQEEVAEEEAAEEAAAEEKAEGEAEAETNADGGALGRARGLCPGAWGGSRARSHSCGRKDPPDMLSSPLWLCLCLGWGSAVSCPLRGRGRERLLCRAEAGPRACVSVCMCVHTRVCVGAVYMCVDVHVCVQRCVHICVAACTCVHMCV